jgi:2-C-methyl-D-erythritol 4-phosphate cytidylyltransferase
VERLGGVVQVVPDQGTNLKLTTQSDFTLAEALLRGSP